MKNDIFPDDPKPDRGSPRHDGRGREAAEGHQHLRQGLPGLRRLQALTNHQRLINTCQITPCQE